MAGISSLWITFLSGTGAVTLLYTTFSIFRFLTFHFITPSHRLQAYKRAGNKPAYALITGSSAGIGLGVAQALVKEGFAVILLGHLPDELAEAKLTLLTIRPDAVVRILIMDVTKATPKEMETVVQSITHLQVSILVNNVGGNPVELPPFRTLATYSSEDVDTVINMNARFMARLTALMLPILTRKPGPKERSLILNMSSSGRVGVPWLVMYGATKAFNWAFSSGLAFELGASAETKHIDCLAIVPGEVQTQGHSEGVAESEPRWDHFGQCIVDKVDNAISRGHRDLHPFMMHDVKDMILEALPPRIRANAVRDVLGKKRDAFNTAWEKSR